MSRLRKGHCYTRIKRSYTRKSKVKSKSYIKTVPANKITRYTMGDHTKQYDYGVHLISRQPIQIR